MDAIKIKQCVDNSIVCCYNASMYWRCLTCKETDKKNLSLLLKVCRSGRGEKFFPNLHAKFMQSLHLVKGTNFFSTGKWIIETLLYILARG